MYLTQPEVEAFLAPAWTGRVRRYLRRLRWQTNIWFLDTLVRGGLPFPALMAINPDRVVRSLLTSWSYRRGHGVPAASSERGTDR